jgi:hypothetical protein
MSSDRHLIATLWAVLFSIGVAAVGIGLLFLAAKVSFFIDHPGTQSVVRSLAGLLVVSVAIAFLWQLHGKRAFLTEILAKARLSEDVRRAGVSALGMNYLKDFNWEEMFKRANKLDIFFAYGASWRRHTIEQLRELARRGGCRVRIVMPDPYDETLVKGLAAQFGQKPDTLKSRILEAKDEFDKIFGKAPGVEYGVWYLGEHPAFTYYRLDDVAVVTFYSHLREYEKTPVLKVDSGAEFYEFLHKEFRFLVVGDPSKKPPVPPLARKCASERSETEISTERSENSVDELPKL